MLSKEFSSKICLPEARLYYDSFEYAPEVLAQILASRAGISGRREPAA